METLPELNGYLLKKSRQGRYQKRWFEATSHYLTYYKNAESDKLLACIDLWRSGNIQLGIPAGTATTDTSPADFSLRIGDQDYLLRAADRDEAIRWVQGLKARQAKQEGANSDAYSHHEECYNDTSSEVSSVYNDDTRSSLGPNARPTFSTLDREEAAAQALVGVSVRHAPPPPIIPLQAKMTSSSFRTAAPIPPAQATIVPPSPYFSAPPPQTQKTHDDDKVTVCCGRCQFM
ncbi:hypothetical protein H310_03479 [Aphanomyces invadans]|uniref:PH domain-containing protein n=1 Tax=Aphanomyces invadans TaxID=157072 RepID=A0A024UHV9_9STRA|nr:hypothetical protein H310_03479 [Aphanomyces invadans]ETW05795.1 hypothetical protein H310_03479 [Aphanomyces invadans]|eukprot:XP_008865572.1 hypothetical protein H310_03479 [Aphanomyces invadans]